MPVDNLTIDLVAHCIEFMSDKETIMSLFDEKGVRYPNNASFQKLALAYLANPEAITIDDICQRFRQKWTPCDIERHIAHLTSGLLKGHNWHGARPSMLHLSLQDRVRECCDGLMSLEEYLSVGTDIVRHEYFMVASHDICETSLIQRFDSVIPPIGSKSVTDFIFDGIPYDLKITSHPDSWKPLAGKMTVEDKKKLAYELYEGADSERMRKIASRCMHNWGLNRMYYIVNDQDKWLNDPRVTVQFLLDNVEDESNYFDIVVHGFNIHIGLIEQ